MELHPGPTSNRFISQRLRLHYVDWGNPEAPTLILQHGGLDHCRSWDWVAEELSKDWHVICPDLRGHGDSDWSPEGNYSMDAFVYDFAQLIHTLGDKPVTIIAHSLGGNIATRYCGLYPEKVLKLVNIEGLGPPPALRRENEAKGIQHQLSVWMEDKRKAASRSVRKYESLEEAQERMKVVNPFLNDAQAKHLTLHGANRNEDGTWSWKFDNYVHVWTSPDWPTEQIYALWKAITCPILVFWGNNSFAQNPNKDDRLEQFSNVRMIEYDNSGHWVHHDRFDSFMTEVKAFLGQ